jgi:hypothetical protein
VQVLNLLSTCVVDSRSPTTSRYVLRSVKLPSLVGQVSDESSNDTAEAAPFTDYFNHAFDLVCEASGTYDVRDFDPVASCATTLFNLALTFHRSAIIQGSSGGFRKALQLYEKASSIIGNIEYNDNFSLLLLACHFNMMRIYSDFFGDLVQVREEQARLTVLAQTSRIQAYQVDEYNMADIKMLFTFSSESFVAAAAA